MSVGSVAQWSHAASCDDVGPSSAVGALRGHAKSVKHVSTANQEAEREIRLSENLFARFGMAKCFVSSLDTSGVCDAVVVAYLACFDHK